MSRVVIMAVLMMTAACLANEVEAAPAADMGTACRAPDPASWWGRFSGGKESYGAFDQDIIIRHTEERCFRTQAGCKAWLYALQSEFGYAPGWNECRKGYRPSTAVKPWYAPRQ